MARLQVITESDWDAAGFTVFEDPGTFAGSTDGTIASPTGFEPAYFKNAERTFTGLLNHQTSPVTPFEFLPGNDAGDPFPVSLMYEFKFKFTGSVDTVTRVLLHIGNSEQVSPNFGGFAKCYGFNSSSQPGLVFSWGDNPGAEANRIFTLSDLTDIKDGNFHLIRCEMTQSVAGQFNSSDIIVYYDDQTRSSPASNSGGGVLNQLGNWNSSISGSIAVGGNQAELCQQGSYGELLISSDVNDEMILVDNDSLYPDNESLIVNGSLYPDDSLIPDGNLIP